MEKRVCPTCHVSMPTGCFRKGKPVCVWCEWASMGKRAAYRFRDLEKHAKNRVAISKADFVNWYESQRDCCAYCGLTSAELKQLKIKRGAGYCVSWDIDRVDSARRYERGNLALSCFVCNMAKGDMLSKAEAHIIGRAVRAVWRKRLAVLPNKALQATAKTEPPA